MLALGGAAAVTMFATGSRGPVLAVAVALATVAAFAPASGVYRTVRIAAITLVMFLSWYFVRGDTTGGAGRIAATLLAGSDQGTSSQDRLSMWREAWDVIPGHFWGLGWGGLGDLGPLSGGGLLGQGGVLYPHDIFLEVDCRPGHRGQRIKDRAHSRNRPYAVGVWRPGVLADPQITVFSGSTQIASNANWNNGTGASSAAQLVSTSAEVGAFPLPSGSKDAALIVTLQPGPYTVQVTSVSGATGVALIEVYDTQD